jgi:hypothetical protein
MNQAASLMMVSSMTLKMEAICFSDMLADLQQAMQIYIHQKELFITSTVRTSNPVLG